VVAPVPVAPVVIPPGVSSARIPQP
jgi:hypothetical protein